MTLHFQETTPGVHMAMWENPNSGNARTVVVIESLGQFTLYIDGDVAARDLDSFDAATSRAHSILASSGSRRMVQMATALVVFVAVGGAAIGVTHLLSGASGIATAVATESQSIVKDVSNTTRTTAQTQPTAFNPVKSVKQPVVVSKVQTNSTTSAVPTSKPVVINSTIPAPTAQADAQINSVPAANQAPTAETANSEQSAQSAGPRVFSATRPVFAGAPEKQPTTKVARQEQTIPAAPVTENKTLAATEASQPAARTATAIENEAASEVASTGQPLTSAQPEAQPLPDRNPAPRFAGLENNETQEQGVAVAPVAPQVAPSPYQTGTTTARQARSADAAYEQLMEQAAAKRRAKIEQRRLEREAAKYQNKSYKKKKYTTKTYKKKKVVKKKKHTRKARRTYRRKNRRVMRCMMNGCRWVARGGYYDRQYRRRHY